MSDITRFLAESVAFPQKSPPVLLACRARLARNLLAYHFPDSLSPKKREEVKSYILKKISQSDYFRGWTSFEQSALSPLEQKLLVERHLISRELVEREGAAVVISPNQKISLMINEEDHFRLQVLDTSGALKDIQAEIARIGNVLCDMFEIAFSDRYGFLTSCPTNIGTGLRISAMVHLPGLVMDGQMEKVVRALGMCGLVARGAFGEGSDSIGSIFQISNRYTLGQPEDRVAANLQEWLDGIIEQEKLARRRVMLRGKVQLFDQISRAYGEARYAFAVSGNEATNMLSLLRMACDLGAFPDYARTRFDELLVEAQSAHLAFRNRGAGAFPEDVQARFRATLFREHFSMIPPPNFLGLA